MPPFVFQAEMMNTLPHTEYDITNTTASLLRRMPFTRIPTVTLKEFVIFVNTTYDEDDIVPYYLESLNDSLFELAKNTAAQVIIQMLTLGGLSSPQFFQGAPRHEGECAYLSLLHHLPPFPLPSRFFPEPLSFITECDRFLLLTACVPVYTALLVSSEIIVLPLLPADEEHETRGFSDKPKDHYCFATIVEDIRSISCETIITILYNDEILVFDPDFLHLYQRHRIMNFRQTFYLPSTTMSLIGKDDVIQQLKIAQGLFGK
jgi:hypothetical protein